MEKSGKECHIWGWGFDRGYIGLSNETIKNFEKNHFLKIFFHQAKNTDFWPKMTLFFSKKKKKKNFKKVIKSGRRPYFEVGL